jgi:hypothetical protein
MPGPLPFVIVSTPRSGTGYIWKLLSVLGVPCNHEEHINSNVQNYHPADGAGVSSWLAVPFLDQLPPTTMVLHQTRNPLRTINSLRLTHRYSSTGRDMAFLRANFRPQTSQHEIEFWYEWHKRIEQFEDLRYPVENPPLAAILSLIGHHREDKEIREALAAVPCDFHTSGNVPQDLNWPDLPPQVLSLARSYGYEIS